MRVCVYLENRLSERERKREMRGDEMRGLTNLKIRIHKN